MLSPEDQEDVESPLPSNIVQPVRRRGAISAEPINEEDAATYIKKVIYITFCSPFIFSTATFIIRFEILFECLGYSQGLQNYGISVQGNCQECPVQSS